MDVTSIWPSSIRYFPPTFTCGAFQMRTLQVTSPLFTRARSFFVKSIVLACGSGADIPRLIANGALEWARYVMSMA